MISGAVPWDTEHAAELARMAFRYVAGVYLPDAQRELLGIADMAVLETQECGDSSGYVEALRELMRTTKRVAVKAE
jgi:hypothetical protein